MSEQSSLPDRRVTEADRERIDLYFSQVLDFPQEFKSWITEFVPLYSTIFQEAVQAAAAAGTAEHFIGEPFMWAATAPPPLSLLCDGTDYAEVDKPDLFDVIGNTFDTYRGAGDPGAGRFRVPDYGGLVLVGLDSGDSLFNSLTDQGGVKDTVLPTHNHDISPDPHAHLFLTGAVQSGAGTSVLLPGAGASSGAGTSLTVDNEGVTATNKNLQPYGVAAIYIYAGV